MMNYANGYPTWGGMQPNYTNYQPYGMQQNQNLQQNQVPSFSTIFVSNIAEAIATKPDVTGKPLFFYNKADEEIYVKQYDSTGSAPVKTYKLAIDTNEPQNNPIVDGIKVLDDKLNDIKKLLTPEIIEEPEKKGRR